MNKPVLLVDDSESDRMLLRHAFLATDGAVPIVELDGGEAAERYLRGEGKYANRERYPLPCLVITDLKMPKVNGFDLLRWMGGRSELQEIPKLVLSNSGESSDKQMAAELGASGYFVKPMGIADLVKLVCEIEESWIEPHCGAKAASAGVES